MSEILKAASEFFAGQRWPWRQVERPLALEVSSLDPELHWKNYAQSKNDDRVFVYYSVCPENAPAERRAAVASFLCHVNFNLLVGAWEMDMDDGETRFRTSIDLRGEPLTQQMISRVVINNHDVMLTWLPGLLQVIRGEQTPQAAFQEAMDSLVD